MTALPLIPLCTAALGSPSNPVGSAFWRSVVTSAQVAVGGAFIAFLIGLPLGVGMAITDFPGKRLNLVLIALPLVVPSFLWAIGWSTLGSHYASVRALAGSFRGCILVGATTTTALVLFASYAGALELSRSQHEAALLAGGERVLLERAAQHALRPAILAATLGAVLTLSDPGPGQILGVHTVSAEILTSFAARYDLALAARQCLILTVLVFSLALPLAWLAGPRMADGVLPRQLAGPRPRRRTRLGIAVGMSGAAVAAVAVFPPVAGLLVPLVNGDPLVVRDGVSEEAWVTNHVALGLFGALRAAVPTALNSVFYAVGAGLLATLFAAALALAVGRSRSLRVVALSACIVLFAWPSLASALAVADIGSRVPRALDFLFRSRITVCLVLAGHFAPIAVVLLLRATGTLSPSWTHAAAIHGVGLGRYLRRIVWPAMLPSAALSLVLVALLASADAGSVLLLHPPGEASLALAIVTVMANAPEAYVSALCLVYLLSTVTLLVATLALARRGEEG
jgi:iron(III) transport system permease protein